MAKFRHIPAISLRDLVDDRRRRAKARRDSGLARAEDVHAWAGCLAVLEVLHRACGGQEGLSGSERESGRELHRC